MVMSVIMMVNGNIGAGVAVAGAFGLVRFRSAPGTGREIALLFMEMGTGMILGMGYLGYGILYTAIVCGIYLLYVKLNLGGRGGAMEESVLHVTIPEDLDYTEIFDDILETYTGWVGVLLVLIFLWLAQKIAAAVSGFDPTKMPPAPEAQQA